MLTRHFLKEYTSSNILWQHFAKRTFKYWHFSKLSMELSQPMQSFARALSESQVTVWLVSCGTFLLDLQLPVFLFLWPSCSWYIYILSSQNTPDYTGCNFTYWPHFSFVTSSSVSEIKVLWLQFQQLNVKRHRFTTSRSIWCNPLPSRTTLYMDPLPTLM